MYNSKDVSCLAVLTQERLLRVLKKDPALAFDCIIVDEAHEILENNARSRILADVIIVAQKRNPDVAFKFLTPFLADSKNLKIRYTTYDIEVILEGVDNKMRDSIYKEYEEAMELLGIKQMILQGPPGTSKTYSAKAFLKYMAHNCSDEELAALQIVDYFAEDKYCAKLRKEKGDPEIAWDIVQFHPSYGYEDFVRGIKVSTKPGSDTYSIIIINRIRCCYLFCSVLKPINQFTKYCCKICTINFVNNQEKFCLFMFLCKLCYIP